MNVEKIKPIFTDDEINYIESVIEQMRESNKTELRAIVSCCDTCARETSKLLDQNKISYTSIPTLQHCNMVCEMIPYLKPEGIKVVIYEDQKAHNNPEYKEIIGRVKQANIDNRYLK